VINCIFPFKWYAVLGELIDEIRIIMWEREKCGDQIHYSNKSMTGLLKITMIITVK